jgi:hypothetical protein
MLFGTSINDAFNVNEYNNIPLPNIPPKEHQQEIFTPPWGPNNNNIQPNLHDHFNKQSHQSHLIPLPNEQLQNISQLKQLQIIDPQYQLQQQQHYQQKQLEQQQQQFQELLTKLQPKQNNIEPKPKQNFDNNCHKSNDTENINLGINKYNLQFRQMEEELVKISKQNRSLHSKMEQYKNYYNQSKNKNKNKNKNNIEHFGTYEGFQDSFIDKNYYDILLFIILGLFIIILLDTILKIKSN